MCVLYNLLSLFQLGYDYIAIDLAKNLNLEAIYNDKALDENDRILLAIMLKSDHVFDNFSDLNTLLQIQRKLLNKSGYSEYDIDVLLSYIGSSDDMMKYRIYSLLGHYVDKKYYNYCSNYCSKEILIKYIDEIGFIDNVLSKSDNIRKYSAYHKDSIRTIYKNNYKDSDVEVYSFSNIIGNNLYVIKTRCGSLVVDAGKKADSNGNVNYEAFFNKYGIDKSDVKAVIYTHAHLDHIGNADRLYNFLGDDVPIYVTEKTKILSDEVNDVSFNGFSNVIEILERDTAIINRDMTIEFYPNGHILGSICFVLCFYDKKLLFTSDFCLHEQLTLKGMDLDLIKQDNGDIDYLVLESTYGDKNHYLEYHDNVKIFKNIISLLKKYDIKVFLPAFAIGRSQEIVAILKSMELDLIHIEGSAKNVCEIYDLGLLEGNVNRNLYEDIKTITDFNDFIIASSGTLMEQSMSKQFYDYMMELDENVALIKTGYIDERCNGAILIDDWQNCKDNFVFDISLSSHASYYDLLSTILSINPNVVISVHGDGIDI